MPFISFFSQYISLRQFYIIINSLSIHYIFLLNRYPLETLKYHIFRWERQPSTQSSSTHSTSGPARHSRSCLSASPPTFSSSSSQRQRRKSGDASNRKTEKAGRRKHLFPEARPQSDSSDGVQHELLTNPGRRTGQSCSSKLCRCNTFIWVNCSLLNNIKLLYTSSNKKVVNPQSIAFQRIPLVPLLALVPCLRAGVRSRIWKFPNRAEQFCMTTAPVTPTRSISSKEKSSKFSKKVCSAKFHASIC